MNTRTPEAKLDDLQNFLDIAGEVLGDVPSVIRSRAVAERCGDRLRYPLHFTTVALAGTTGSGKSSMFNAFTTIDRSPAGILRPTTSEPYACVWGALSQADELLDWLGVAPRRRFTRESPLDANDELALRGMILLDLPDVDSIEPRHRVVVDRLLHLVDVVVWVCDPQKYADQLVHEGYLRRLAGQRSGVIIALNQTDKLLSAHLPKVGTDLRQLLDAGGLAAVPLVATSATGRVPEQPAAKRGGVKPGPFFAEMSAHGWPGIASLRALLEPVITGQRAGLDTVDRDVTATLRELKTLVAGRAIQALAGPLVDALLVKDIDTGIKEYATASGNGLPDEWREAIFRAVEGRTGEVSIAVDRAIEFVEANRPRRSWVPGGRKRADSRADLQLRHEIDKVALRHVIEPVRRVLAVYERARVALDAG